MDGSGCERLRGCASAPGVSLPKPRSSDGWLGREDSNLRMPESKSGALPLGDAPIADGPRTIVPRIGAFNGGFSAVGPVAGAGPYRYKTASRGNRRVAQPGRAPRSGRGGRRFESSLSDHPASRARASQDLSAILAKRDALRSLGEGGPPQQNARSGTPAEPDGEKRSLNDAVERADLLPDRAVPEERG